MGLMFTSREGNYSEGKLLRLQLFPELLKVCFERELVSLSS